ncbi:MAG: 4-hydroxy-3-methylbut-2-enyl diphosphate reductase [Candidatus Omnitrophica bacterium]|nr:4-hydroxy-3-methylbut-2-enyl diphosphate reductase [Candidatus Omnitrophota bacterium]
MRINIAKSASFCFGVKRALEIVFKAAQEVGRVYTLGDIVHNEDVAGRIEKSGIKKIGKLKKIKSGSLLIPAHGASRKIFTRASRLGYTIIDATCPMVKEIHKIVKEMRKKGYRIIVIGDKDHDEVRGIAGQLKEKILVIENINRIPLARIKKIKRACVVAQSTQNLKNVLKIVAILKNHVPDLEFFNTICRPTRTKQEEIRRMPLENDVMIIIGSKNSANTKRLYEISRSLNKRSWWVNSPKEIKPAWFKGARSAGISAGASTPEDTIKDIVKYIRSIPG